MSRDWKKRAKRARKRAHLKRKKATQLSKKSVKPAVA